MPVGLIAGALSVPFHVKKEGAKSCSGRNPTWRRHSRRDAQKERKNCSSYISLSRARLSLSSITTLLYLFSLFLFLSLSRCFSSIKFFAIRSGLRFACMRGENVAEKKSRFYRYSFAIFLRFKKLIFFANC